MSKLRVPIMTAIAAILCLLIGASGSTAQAIDAAISFDISNKTALVTGRFIDGMPRRVISFLPSAIGVPDLGKRISDVTVKTSGQIIAAPRQRPAEYTSTSEITEFSYRIDLGPQPDTRSAAHASWITDSIALLLLDDILPLPGPGEASGARIRINTPAGWSIRSDATPSEGGVFELSSIERAVFFLGKDLKRFEAGTDVDLLMSGTFLFTGGEAAGMVSEVLRHYTKLFGGRPAGRVLVAIVPFPQANVPKGVWEAETRGRTIVLASSDMPFASQSAQRLHEQLRHEIFHLWLPNGVSLTGKYDWFYEGFGMYAALKAGVAANRIRFEDMLDTLSRAHSIDRARTRPLSLIQASRERWAGAETSVYARGMVTAFICDLEMLRRSRGRASVESVIRRVFSQHRPPAKPADADTAVFQILGHEAGVAAIVSDYIVGDKPIDLTPWLEAAGLENASGTSRTNLRIMSRLAGPQKAILDELGYNNWRKLNRK